MLNTSQGAQALCKKGDHKKIKKQIFLLGPTFFKGMHRACMPGACTNHFPFEITETF